MYFSESLDPVPVHTLTHIHPTTFVLNYLQSLSRMTSHLPRKWLRETVNIQPFLQGNVFLKEILVV